MISEAMFTRTLELLRQQENHIGQGFYSHMTLVISARFLYKV